MLAHDECAPVRRTVYSLNFLLTLITALVAYFTTPMLLARGVSESSIGFVYTGAAILNIIFLFIAPKIFGRFGNYLVFMMLMSASALSLALLAFIYDKWIVIGIVMLYSSITATSYLLLDMVLEGSMPKEGITGGTRGFFITMSEVAWFLGPVLAGWLIGIGSFEMLFVVAAALSVPAISITMRRLYNVRKHHYKIPNVSLTLKKLANDKDMRGAFMTQLLLRIFYAVMVIYVPLYLIEHVGISYSNFGAILSFAMIAYLIFNIPAGILADTRFGEKEIMAIGFLIIAISTALLSIGSGTSVILWGAILFITRIGAAFIDVTTESYFFKHMNGNDADTISAFRMLGPIGYIASPLIGSALLFFLPISYLFLGFGIVLLIGIPFALSLKDTR